MRLRKVLEKMREEMLVEGTNGWPNTLQDIIAALKSGELVVLRGILTIKETNDISDGVNKRLERVWRENEYPKPVPRVSPGIVRYCIEGHLTEQTASQ